VDEDVVEFFRALGAGRLGAKIYCALLASGPLSLSKLSEETGIVAPQLHQYLRRLIALGLIEVSRGKPNVYRAVPLNVLEAVYGEKLERVRERALKKLSSIPKRARLDEREYGVFVVRSWRTFRSRVLEAIRSASYDLLMCGDSAFIRAYWDELKRKEEEGTNLYVILYEVPGIPANENEAKTSRVRKAVSGDFMVISDSRIALVAQRRIGPRDTPEYGLAVEEPVLIDYLQHEFFHRWQRSSVVRDRLPRLPTTYTVLRLALVDAKKLLSEGKRLRVTAYGRFVGAKSETVVEGLVAGVTLDQTAGIAHFTLETPAGTIRVGGPDAIVEEFAAHKIELREAYG